MSVLQLVGHSSVHLRSSVSPGLPVTPCTLPPMAKWDIAEQWGAEPMDELRNGPYTPEN